MNDVERIGIDKTKVGLIVAVALVVILAVSSLWLYTTVDYWRRKASVWELFSDTLQYDVDALQDEVDDLTTENTRLENEFDWLNSEYDNYVTLHSYSNWEYDEAQFDFYYVLPEEQWFGVYDLEDDLYGEWIDPYQRGVFDCSEMSAYMEWELENIGWHTKIVIGDTPFGSGYHAWLLVETSEGAYMPVEATTAEIVWWNDPYFDNYFEYDRSFETILDALEYSETEFDWWV